MNFNFKKYIINILMVVIIIPKFLFIIQLYITIINLIKLLIINKIKKFMPKYLPIIWYHITF